MNENLVTNIKIQTKNKKRVNVCVDGKFLFSCSIQIVYKYGIEKGKKIDKEYLENIVKEDNYIRCKNASLKIIERSFKTEKQIRDKLLKKEYDADTIERTLDFLKEHKFVDDLKYVKIYIGRKLGCWGKEKMKYELLRKGISRNIIDDQLQDIDGTVYEENALQIGVKKYNSILKNCTSEGDAYRKLGNYLAGKGYDIHTVKKTLHEIINKEDFSQEEKNCKKDINNIYAIAKKRYNIIAGSCNDDMKIARNLGQYMLRRGYKWDDVKSVIKEILKEDVDS